MSPRARCERLHTLGERSRFRDFSTRNLQFDSFCHLGRIWRFGTTACFHSPSPIHEKPVSSIRRSSVDFDTRSTYFTGTSEMGVRHHSIIRFVPSALKGEGSSIHPNFDSPHHSTSRGEMRAWVLHLLRSEKPGVSRTSHVETR